MMFRNVHIHLLVVFHLIVYVDKITRKHGA